MAIPKSLMERVRIQLDGLKAAPDINNGAPLPAVKLTALLDETQALDVKQEQLKADLHAATQQLKKKTLELRDAQQRNLAYAQAVLGKFDKRLESFGGRAVTGGRPRKTTAPPAPAKK